VDRLGTLQDAIEEAGRMAGIKGEPEVILPPKRKLNYLDLLSGGVEEKFEGVLNKSARGMQLMYE
jgi:protease-4